MNPLYSFLLVVMLFFSCKKDEESELWTEVHVSATNYITGEPINDVIVGVYERKTKLMLQDSEVEVLKEELLVNGQFSFGWKAKKNSKYGYEFAAATDFEKYYKISMTQFAYLEKGGIHNFQLSLVPYSYITFNILNASCFNSNDMLYLTRESETGYSGYSPVTLMGCYSSATGVYGKVPSGKWFFEWEVTKNSSTEVFQDTISLVGGDSTIYYLEY